MFTIMSGARWSLTVWWGKTSEWRILFLQMLEDIWSINFLPLRVGLVMNDRYVDTCVAFCSYISRVVELGNRSMLISPVRNMELPQIFLVEDKTASILTIHSIFLAFWELKSNRAIFCFYFFPRPTDVQENGLD